MAHDRSTNHGFPLLQQGEEIDNWGNVVRTEAFVPLEERLMVVDTSANRSNYTPYADAIFYETDTGKFYEGDGTSWNEAEIENRFMDEKVIQGTVFAGHPDFATLQEAVDFATTNNYSLVQLPPETFSNSVTATDVTLIGAGSYSLNGLSSPTKSEIDAPVTIEGDGGIVNCALRGDVTFQNEFYQVMSHCRVSNNTTDFNGALVSVSNNRFSSNVTVAGDRGQVIGNFGGSYDIDGDENVVIGNTNSSITDNGVDNQVGFNT